MNRRALLAAPLLRAVPIQAQMPSSSLRIGLIGQSNLVGPAPLTLQVPWQKVGDRFTFAPTCMYPNGVRGILNEPSHGGTHLFTVTNSSPYGVGYVSAMVRQLLLGGIEQVEVVACAKSGSAVGSWLWGATTLSTNYLFGAAKAICDLAGPIDLFYWHQGETDSKAAYESGLYQTNEAQLAALFQQHLGAPMMTCLLQTCEAATYPYQGAVNAAKQANWASGATLQGPDFRDLTCAPENSVHLVTASKLETAGMRAGQSILSWWQARSLP